MLLRLLILVVTTCSFTSSLHLKEDNYLLPTNVKPIRYSLTMVPNFETDTFSGTVAIEIIALEKSNFITFHSHNLNMPPKEDITVIELETNRALLVESAEISNVEYQYFTVSLSDMLIDGNSYILNIPNFNADFSKSATGFASSTFKENGSICHYAYTQFEPCYARRAFPCFDEPALRANFNIKLVRPNNKFISASNSPLISQSTSAPLEDVFEETVEMPTYLVAFTITEMRFSENLDIYRIIARPEPLSLNQHKYALNLTPSIMNFMESFTETPFTLPKLDQIAIPYYPGAMENWGLVVYGESYLILTKPEYKKGTVSIMTHELGHQWFGNLVGPTWWEYIWLNEGFASYFECLIPGLVEPEIDGRGLFQAVMQKSFVADMPLFSRPLTQNAKTPSEISMLFDNIAYSKGGTVIRMLEKSLTTPVFKQGIQYYVEKMQFKQAASSDLYEGLQKAVDENQIQLPDSLTVSNIMYAWEWKKGFPVVDINRSYGSNNKNVHLKQSRYNVFPESAPGEWVIPINFAVSSNPSFENTDPEHWMIQGEETVYLPYLNDDNWLIANKMETGYYRVNYDVTNWNLIIETLMTSHLDIHVLNRAQLIDDSLNLGRTGRLEMEIALDLVDYLQYEKDPIPWQAYYTNSRRLRNMFYYSSSYNIYKAYIFNITKSAYNYVCFEKKSSESVLQTDLRKIILDLLCNMDHPDCLHKSLIKYKHLQNNKQSLLKLDESTLCGAVRAGKDEVFSTIFDVLLSTNQPQPNIIKGLSCSKNTQNLNKLLALEKKLPVNELIEMVAESGPEGLDTAINFVVENFKELETKLEEKIVFLLQNLSTFVSTRYHLNKLQNAASISNYKHLLEGAFFGCQENINWRRNNLMNFTRMLQNKI